MTQICCRPRRLPADRLIHAAKLAHEQNPVNRPLISGLARLLPGVEITAQHIAVMTKKYWGPRGVRLTVAFMEYTARPLQVRILEHMNAWSKTANVAFVLSTMDPLVRISRDLEGNWSYLGTDILSIAPGEATMSLQEFSMETPESEYRRVVRHEAGHTLGFPHEHMRKALVELLDPEKTREFFAGDQGWTHSETDAQVLKSLEESDLMGTPPDQDSIMCYQIPGAITRDGRPIAGGADINASDYAFAAKIYPKPSA